MMPLICPVLVTVRPANEADVPVIVTMARRFLRETGYGGIIRENPAQLETFARRLIAEPYGDVLLLDVDTQIVGLIGLLAVPHYLSGDVIATEVCWWVDPAHRGDGRRLLAAAEVWAQAHGAVALHMVAPSDRVGRVYERLGYRFVEAAYQKVWTA